MYDLWMLVAGLILAIIGLPSLLTGKTIIRFERRSKYRYRYNHENEPHYTYYGRGLAAMMMFTAAAILGAYFLSREPDAWIPPQTANIAAGIACLLGGFLSWRLMINNARGNTSAVSDPLKSTPSLSLTQAAHYLKMPRDELLQMAQNGAIKTHFIQSVYHFDKEILDAYREAMGNLQR